MLESLALFWLCFRVGLFTFGGGAAMVPLISQNLVSGGFLTSAEALDMVSISQLTPGPFAVNAATFAGMKLFGLPGALMATLGMALPSVIIAFLVARFFFSKRNHPAVRTLLSGVRPVVLALIAGFVVLFSMQTFAQPVLGDSLWLAALALTVFFLMLRTKVNPIWLLLGSGAIGAVFFS